jgi:hypothetical protein
MLAFVIEAPSDREFLHQFVVQTHLNPFGACNAANPAIVQRARQPVLSTPTHQREMR